MHPRDAGATDEIAIHPAPNKSPLDLSDWKLEDDLREAQRLVRLIQLQCDEPVASPELPADELPVGNAVEERTHRQQRSGSLLGWLVLGCGLSGLVCGCALLGWSHYTGRVELWNIGLPVALVSQAVLACGLILQFDFGGRKAEQHAAAPQAYASPTHLHVNSGAGMQAAGLSVHFSTTPQPQAAMTSRQIKQQVEAALRRRAG
jgi:hypothetical protein